MFWLTTCSSGSNCLIPKCVNLRDVTIFFDVCQCLPKSFTESSASWDKLIKVYNLTTIHFSTPLNLAAACLSTQYLGQFVFATSKHSPLSWIILLINSNSQTLRRLSNFLLFIKYSQQMIYVWFMQAFVKSPSLFHLALNDVHLYIFMP